MRFLFRFRTVAIALGGLLALHAGAADKLDLKTEALGNVETNKVFMVIRVSSGDGCHAALLCAGTKPETTMVIVDGVGGPEFNGILAHTPIFGPNSGRVIYGARIGEKWIVFEPGKTDRDTCPQWDRVLENGFAFSADGKHMAYVAKRGKWYVVADGKENGPYDDIVNLPVFSKDGSRLVYGVSQGNKQMLIDQGKASAEYDLVGAAIVSGDGKRIAYGAQRDGRQFVVVDGSPSDLYGGIYGESLQFSADGRHVAYVAEKGMRRFVVVDGKPGADFESVVPTSLRISPDGSRIGYIVRKGDKWMAVVDGKVGPEYCKAERLLFSADSRHFAYVAGNESSRFVVVDGQQGPEYPEIVNDSLLMGPVGASIAYCAVQNDRKTAVILDGKAMGEYESVGPVSFSPDGRHLAYRASTGETLYVFADGQQVCAAAAMVCDPVFRHDGVLEFLNMDQKTLCRVTTGAFQ